MNINGLFGTNPQPIGENFGRGNLEELQARMDEALFEVTEEQGLIDISNLELFSVNEEATGLELVRNLTATEAADAVKNIQATMADFTASIQDAAGRLETVNGQVSEAAGNLAAANTEVEGALGGVMEAQAALSAAEATPIYDEEGNQIGEDTSAIDAAQAQFDEANQAYEAALQKQEEAAKVLADYEAQAQEIQTELDGYNTGLAEAEGELDVVQGDLQQKLDELDEIAADLQASIDEINGNVAELNEKLVDAQNAYDTAQADYNEAQAAANEAQAAADANQAIASEIGVEKLVDEETGETTFKAPESYDEKEVAASQMLHEFINGGASTSNLSALNYYPEDYELNTQYSTLSDNERLFQFDDKNGNGKFFVRQELGEDGEWKTTVRTRIEEDGTTTREYLDEENTNGGKEKLFEKGYFDDNGDWQATIHTTIVDGITTRTYVDENNRIEVGGFTGEQGAWEIDKRYTGDGIIDDSKQGDTGDCYLLNGLHQLSRVDWGQQAISDALELHDDGSYTISFQGHEPINLSKEELDEAMRLTNENGKSVYSSGDRDTLAIEVALNKLEGVDLDGGNATKVLDLFFGHDENGIINGVDGSIHGVDTAYAGYVFDDVDMIAEVLNDTTGAYDINDNAADLVMLLEDMADIMDMYGTTTKDFTALQNAVIDYINGEATLNEVNAQINAFNEQYAENVRTAMDEGRIVGGEEDINESLDMLYEEYTSGEITHLNEVGLYVGDEGHSVSITGFEQGDDGEIYVLYNNPWDSSETYKDTLQNFKKLTGMITIYGLKDEAQAA